MSIEELGKIRESFAQRLAKVKDARGAEALRVALLGRKGELTLLLRGVSKLPADQRKEVGRQANLLKDEVQAALDGMKTGMVEEETERALAAKTDLTMPGRVPALAGRHPLAGTVREALDVLRAFGFNELEVPELETEWYNFEALNTPQDHPSRDLQDSFYLEGGLVLRTHTSTVQIHAMEKMKPPLRVMAAGKCYRRDAIDATHYPIFHQIDALLVDEQVSFCDLKGLLEHFGRVMLGKDTKTRFRPHYFPFTEPSAEFDFSCSLCDGKGCPTCKGQGWLEIGGAGMVDPNVFEAVKLDPEKYQGLAFGLGLERIAMIRHGIDDIRLFYENDSRFLRQFT